MKVRLARSILSKASSIMCKSHIFFILPICYNCSRTGKLLQNAIRSNPAIRMQVVHFYYSKPSVPARGIFCINSPAHTARRHTALLPSFPRILSWCLFLAWTLPVPDDDSMFYKAEFHVYSATSSSGCSYLTIHPSYDPRSAGQLFSATTWQASGPTIGDRQTTPQRNIVQDDRTTGRHVCYRETFKVFQTSVLS